VSAHRAQKLAAWGSLAPLALLFVAPWLTQHMRLWYALCSGCALLVLGSAWRLASAIQSPLHTAANLVTALREGNYSLRVRCTGQGAAAELLFAELNALAAELRKDRLDETEASELLAKVMSEIDTAVLAVDAEGRVVLENPAAAALFCREPGTLTGQTPASLGLGPALPARGTVRFSGDLPGALGPFDLCMQPFRYRGREHALLVLTSLARLLRDEERRAQRRIISVLSHEINNSLAPIKSLAGRLQSLARRLLPAPASAESQAQEAFEQLETGLSVIERRAEHLGRVMRDYAKLARTAAPTFRPLVVSEWLGRNARLWPQLVLAKAGADDVVLAGDEALLDQLLLNLLKNALEAMQMQAEAAAQPDGSTSPEPVSLSWSSSGRWLTLVIADRGPGLQGDIDPFLPFVTSKPQGSGIGLALCREIADAHGGRLELSNRDDGPGCLARLTLPLEQD
jgi:nitrogen fixation/metabolism regulation signal transduction histidine kinase